MKWRGRKGSENVEDRRSARIRRAGLSGSMLGILVLGLGIYAVATGDTRGALSIFGRVIQQTGGVSAYVGTDKPRTRNLKLRDEDAKMVSVVLRDLEKTWEQQFRFVGKSFSPATLVLFRDLTQTACGYGQSETGPFYCSADNKIYLDLSFVDELKKLGASGDFALAYVLAHETGHHIQTLLGDTQRLRNKQGRASRIESNRLQVGFELQADCYAGVWAHAAQQQKDFLESGDIEEGLKAAAVVGDDYLQRRSGRAVNPESFTHGSSEQRMNSFRRGLNGGSLASCS